MHMQFLRLIGGALALLMAAPQAGAAFLTIEAGAYTLPSDPLKVLSEQGENVQLREQLASAEARIKDYDDRLAQLDARELRLKDQQVQLVEAQQRLDDQITANMPKKATVYFQFGSVTFTPGREASAKINQAVEVADRVVVNGFTDNRGTVAANAAIALKRAVAAKDYLLAKGVEEVKIRIYARSGAYARSNSTEAGRAANRRVDLLFERDKHTPSVAMETTEFPVMGLSHDAIASIRGHGPLSPELEQSVAQLTPPVTATAQ